ncbi:16S rRNA (guanine(527)-N(7))-methyltransferase RsmG [Oceanicella actignis]|uniref:16S rRNA (guanine(527)-N(7))-methyltransferase RsmG n=1 Tax=Oceanicella actignis TaxID=1189325 RepID=UPI0011E77441|nr:16S rRNA (guanine(527)-N(7))-methyltransferase RsmG [Oceanicella actignis]
MNRRDVENFLANEVGVSRETLERLDLFEQLLGRWNRAINLVGPSTLDSIWERHFADSAQLWLLRPEVITSWLDLGSGGGFPGLVIAAIAAELNPTLQVTLVESDSRKCAFLLAAAREMSVNTTVLNKRIESIPAGPHEVISARALAPLSKLLDMTERFAPFSPRLLFPKGANALSELTEARKSWNIDARLMPSRVDPRGQILEISRFSRVQHA